MASVLGKHNDTIIAFSNGNLPNFTEDEWAIVYGSYDLSVRAAFVFPVLVD